MVSQRTLLAILLAILTAIGAHDSGKPWWVDSPLFGDAFDIGLFSFVIIRTAFSLFDKELNERRSR